MRRNFSKSGMCLELCWNLPWIDAFGEIYFGIGKCKVSSPKSRIGLGLCSNGPLIDALVKFTSESENAKKFLQTGNRPGVMFELTMDERFWWNLLRNRKMRRNFSKPGIRVRISTLQFAICESILTLCKSYSQQTIQNCESTLMYISRFIHSLSQKSKCEIQYIMKNTVSLLC